jgi:pyruvate,water dikinase
LFDERNDAVLRMIAQAIDAAKTAQKSIGICGQAPSDYPEFAEWLVKRGITSISLNPDTAIKTALLIGKTELQLAAAEITAA